MDPHANACHKDIRYRKVAEVIVGMVTHALGAQNGYQDHQVPQQRN